MPKIFNFSLSKASFIYVNWAKIEQIGISKQRQVRKDRVQEYIQKDKMGASQINVAEGGDYNAITEEDEF